MNCEILNFCPLLYWSIFLMTTNGFNLNVYKKSYIEDLCLFNESIEYELENSGLKSAINIGTTPYSSSFSDRNCTIEIRSPVGKGVILKIFPMYFGHNVSSKCSDYLQIYDDIGNSTTLCGLHTESSTFITRDKMKLEFYTSARNMLITGEGFTLVATSFTKDKKFCNANRFICGTGECIWRGFACDGVENCPDSSDEKIFCVDDGEITTNANKKISPTPWISPTSEKSPFAKSTNAVVGISVAATILIIFFLVAYSYSDISGLIRSFCQYYRDRRRDNTRDSNISRPSSDSPSAPPLTSLMSETNNDASNTMDYPFIQNDRCNDTIYKDLNRIPQINPDSDLPPSYELAVGIRSKK